MTRADAVERVRKLRALAADRAATPAESKLAAEKAAMLFRKHGLSELDLNPPPPVPMWPHWWPPRTNVVWAPSGVTVWVTWTTTNHT